jgi:hypothetical protein
MSRLSSAIVGLGSCLLVLAACTPSGGVSASLPPASAPAASAAAPSVAATSTAASAGPSAVALGTPAATASPSPASNVPSAVPTAIDPCALVTSAEASKLAGITYGPGKAETTPTGEKKCSYGAGATNLIQVGVLESPDMATINAAKVDALAEIQQLVSKGIKVTQLPTLGDGGAVAQGTAGPLNVSAIDVTKGLIFFHIGHLAVGRPAATSAALQAQAETVLGRLP